MARAERRRERRDDGDDGGGRGGGRNWGGIVGGEPPGFDGRSSEHRDATLHSIFAPWLLNGLVV